jgi:hypothetical protein
LWPLALILSSVFIMVGLGVFLRLVVDTEAPTPGVQVHETDAEHSK